MGEMLVPAHLVMPVVNLNVDLASEEDANIDIIDVLLLSRQDRLTVPGEKLKVAASPGVALRLFLRSCINVYVSMSQDQAVDIASRLLVAVLKQSPQKQEEILKAAAQAVQDGLVASTKRKLRYTQEG